MKIDKKNILIGILAVALILSVGFIGVSWLSSQNQQVYMQGVRDGQQMAGENMLNQLQQNGQVTMSVNTTQGVQQITLKPVVNEVQ